MRKVLAELDVPVVHGQISITALHQALAAEIKTAQDLQHALTDLFQKHLPEYSYSARYNTNLGTSITIRFASITPEEEKASNVAWHNAKINFILHIFLQDKW